METSFVEGWQILILLILLVGLWVWALMGPDRDDGQPVRLCETCLRDHHAVAHLPHICRVQDYCECPRTGLHV